ncbi:MAG: ABC transporter ATP-binding protein [Thauera sp.]|jgi:lipopolysaccharide transport system ATP-binding protein|nr:ABC transporter ATP-binding protein [Thauera sp.]
MIEVDRLSKRFRFYRRPADRLRELLLRRSFHQIHQALDNISFSVPSGRSLGIIGHNGAGKSTLLKLLSGVLLPDSGQIQRGGRITGLLELGTGFNLDLTGRRNIEHNGLLIGMTAAEIAARREAIIAFAELGSFIDEPLRTYSSGMLMRLAFAIAIHAEPDTFLVDEALSVGDAHFQQKCFRRIRDFRARGGSIILVSHDLNAIKMLCDDAILLDHGKLVEAGEPERVVNVYNFLVARQSDAALELEEHDRDNTDYGTREAEITALELIGDDSGAGVVSSGEQVRFRLGWTNRQPLPGLTAGMLIRDRFGQDVFGTNTALLKAELPLAPGDWQVDFSLELNIAPGKYTLTVALHEDENHLDHCYHWQDNALRFEVAGIRGPRFAGLCRLQPRVAVLQQAEPSATVPN